MQVLTTARTARKVHRCESNRQPGHEIKPGERYVDAVIPPWAMISDDVDEDGRSLYRPFGEWAHSRFHPECEVRW